MRLFCYCCFVCNQDVKEEYRESAIRLVHGKKKTKERQERRQKRIETVKENRQEKGVIGR